MWSTTRRLLLYAQTKSAFRLPLLDIALGEDWVHEIGIAFRTVQPGINLVLLCDEQGDPPLFDALRPWILVRKPFRISEFMNALSQPQSAPKPATPATIVSATMPWLSDVTKAAQHLTRLTLESSAQAALITRRSNLWAYAGGLSQERRQGSGANRHPQLGWTKRLRPPALHSIGKHQSGTHAVCHAPHSDAVLALVFDAETPFSTIRAQATQLLSDFDDSRPRQEAPRKRMNLLPRKCRTSKIFLPIFPPPTLNPSQRVISTCRADRKNLTPTRRAFLNRSPTLRSLAVRRLLPCAGISLQ
jgi:hypothetical protein